MPLNANPGISWTRGLSAGALRASAWSIAAILCVLPCVAHSADAPQKPVSFRGEIAPLLNRHCVVCHGQDTSKGGYRVDSFKRLLKPGDTALPPIEPGKADDSELYRLLIEPEAADRMPQKAEALPAEDIALVKRWIAGGATYDGGAQDTPLVELVREGFLHDAPAHYARPAPVTALAFSPDGSQLAVGGYFEVTLWNVSDGTLARRIGGLPERITSLAWHPERNLLAVAGGSPAQWGGVALVNPAMDFQVRYLCDLPETALSVAFSPDGSQLAAGCGDRTVRLFDMPGGKAGLVLRQHADWVLSVAFSPNGQQIVSASRDRTLRVFSAATGEVQSTYAGHDTPVLAAAFLPDGASVLSLARGKALHVWPVQPSKDSKSKTYSVPAGTEQLALGDFGVITGAADSRVRVHSPGDMQTTVTLSGHDDAVQSIAVSPVGDIFATGSHSGEVCVWKPRSETRVARFVASPR